MAVWRQIVGFGGFSLVMLACWLAIYFYPERLEISQLKARVAEIVRHIEATGAQAKQIETLRHQVEQMAEAVAAYEARLQHRDALPELLRRIIVLGQQYNVTVASIYPRFDQLLHDETSGGAPLLILPVEMQVHGTYHRIGTFLQSLDSQDFLARLVKIDLGLTPESYPRLRGIVEIRLFLRSAYEEQQKG